MYKINMNIFFFARILDFCVNNSKSKNHILTKVTFPKPVQKKLKGSNLLDLYH